MAAPTVLWFRRDLRLAANPALTTAAATGGEVVPLFVLDPRLLGTAGVPRTAFLLGCLRHLDDTIGGRLVVRSGDPREIVPAVAAESGADAVVAAEDFGPYGRRRDDAVAAALDGAGRHLVAAGSPYTVEPGALLTGGGTPFKVFTPYYRAWKAFLRPAAGGRAGDPMPRWSTGVASERLPEPPGTTAKLPPPGESAALARLDRFVADRAGDYDARRNRPDHDATSRLSPYLKYGCIHPAQVLSRLGRSRAHEALRREIAFRDFYADVLWHHPDTLRRPYRPAMDRIRVDDGADADRRFDAWVAGRTGFPLVDAGMRQLAGEAWIHNRVRMVVASFLVKDLHVDWRRGARLFMERLVDGDAASNTHGWQWVAGTGTDPSPFVRVFNPITQAEKFDPDGDYIRRWVPELAHLGAPDIHRPWEVLGGLGHGYPAPIVDHAAERVEALRRYDAIGARG